MSDELYSQQKEITIQKIEIKKLKSKLESIENNIGSLNTDEDPPPPHY